MKKIMTHLVCGFPSIEESQKIFRLLQMYSQFVEVQFPFSDPIADGGTIANANEIALRNIKDTNDVFGFIRSNILDGTSSEIIIMCYFHTIFHYGIDSFIKIAKECRIYGLIVPDIPFDTPDGKYLKHVCDIGGIHVIYTISPNTSERRLHDIANISTGFIYALSQNMTTGSVGTFGESFVEYIQNLRHFFTIPIGVGFGVKSGEQIRFINSVADFSIIGSHMIELYNSGGIGSLKEFLESI